MTMKEPIAPLYQAWAEGFSIAELWGFTKPTVRNGPPEEDNHLMLWGILSIVEYQVSQGAGHRYLRDRLWYGDWIGIGYLEPKSEESALVIVPPIQDAKFGRRKSRIGNGAVNYTDVRIVHPHMLAELNATG